MLPEKVELEFLKKLQDEELQKKLAAAKNPQEALAVVKAEGFDVGLEDFKESMQKLSNYIKPKAGELSDSDLEYVAGGRSSQQSYENAMTGIGTTAAVVGAAAAAA